jgi:signal transduction histidine kinase
MHNSIRVRYFLWLSALLFAFFLINSLALLIINLPSIMQRGPDWRGEFFEWVMITGIGALVLPLFIYAAWRLSRRLLLPLRKMIATTNRIYGGAFDERIEVVNTQDEIAELAASINCALDRYQESVVRQRQFAGMASHQLRTPLTSIRSIGEIALQRERDPAVYREAIAGMLEEAGHLTHVVEQLLWMARFSHDDLRARFAKVPVAGLLQSLEDQYAPLFQEKKLVVELECAIQTSLFGQIELLQQALGNVLDNAVRHTPVGGRITVYAAPGDSGTAEICISDSGPGFARAQATAQEAADAGTGLGLKITREIIHAHGGTLHLEDAPSGGACVRMILPLADSA